MQILWNVSFPKRLPIQKTSFRLVRRMFSCTRALVLKDWGSQKGRVHHCEAGLRQGHNISNGLGLSQGLSQRLSQGLSQTSPLPPGKRLLKHRIPKNVMKIKPNKGRFPTVGSYYCNLVPGRHRKIAVCNIRSIPGR